MSFDGLSSFQKNWATSIFAEKLNHFFSSDMGQKQSRSRARSRSPRGRTASPPREKTEKEREKEGGKEGRKGGGKSEKKTAEERRKRLHLTLLQRKITVSDSVDVRRLKQKIYSVTQIPPERQNLVCNGALLGDDGAILSSLVLSGVLQEGSELVLGRRLVAIRATQTDDNAVAERESESGAVVLGFVAGNAPFAALETALRGALGIDGAAQKLEKVEVAVPGTSGSVRAGITGDAGASALRDSDVVVVFVRGDAAVEEDDLRARIWMAETGTAATAPLVDVLRSAAKDQDRLLRKFREAGGAVEDLGSYANPSLAGAGSFAVVFRAHCADSGVAGDGDSERGESESVFESSESESESNEEPAAVVWEWKDDSGYVKYDENTCLRLESGLQKGQATVRLDTGRGYTVNVNTMEQKNNASGFVRKVRRLGSQQKVHRDVTWQWKDDDGFKAYDDKTRDMIEAAFQRGDPSLKLTHGFFSSPGGYQIDFSWMTQTKVATGFVRKLQREGPPSVATVPVVSEPPTIPVALKVIRNGLRSSEHEIFEKLQENGCHPNLVAMYCSFVAVPTDAMIAQVPQEEQHLLVSVDRVADDRIAVTPLQTRILVLEFFDHNLETYLEVIGGGLTPSHALQLCAQMAAALGHLRSFRYLHLDVKLANFVIREGRVALVDMGSAVQAPGGDGDTFVLSIGAEQEVGGNVAHLAPEFLEARRLVLADPHGSEVEVDVTYQAVWELGVLIWEVLIGEHPFNGYPDAFVDGQLPGVPSDPVVEFLGNSAHVPELAKDITRALSGAPENRIEFDTLVDLLVTAVFGDSRAWEI
jgi:serine/threonine protein kinase